MLFLFPWALFNNLSEVSPGFSTFAQTRIFEHDRRHGARPLFTRTFRTLHHFSVTCK